MLRALRGASFITTLDHDRGTIERLLDSAAAFKKARTRGPSKRLAGKTMALVFLNPSLRTRVSFEVALCELGGTAVTTTVGKDSWTLEHREGAVMDQDRTEHVKDAARVLSRYVHAIGVRSFPGMASLDEDMRDAVISCFRAHATVPVINLESALWHPCQALADALTVRERFKKIEGVKVTLTWAYHPKPLPTAVANSYAAIMSQLGADLTIAHPPGFDLPPEVLRAFPRRPRIVHEKEAALRGASVVYAKSWGALGYYGRWDEEKKLREGLRSWVCDSIPRGAAFLHCLPVRRNVEVTDSVLDQGAIYDEAENRLHVQKALLAAIL